MLTAEERQEIEAEMALYPTKEAVRIGAMKIVQRHGRWVCDVPAHLPMQAAHAMDRPSPANRQIRHIEMLRGVVRIFAAKSQQVMERDAESLGVSTEVLLDEGGRETVKAGRNRGMGSQEIADASRGQCRFEGLPRLFHEASGAFHHGEGRMPLIQVTDRWMDSERAEQPPSTEPQQ